jgi:hypothetical protein
MKYLFDLSNDAFLVSLTNYFLKNFSVLNLNGNIFSFNFTFTKGTIVETGKGHISNSMDISDKFEIIFYMVDESKIMLQLLSELGVCDGSISRIVSLAFRSVDISDICKDSDRVSMELMLDDIKHKSIGITLTGPPVKQSIEYLIHDSDGVGDTFSTNFNDGTQSTHIDHGEISWTQ